MQALPSAVGDGLSRDEWGDFLSAAKEKTTLRPPLDELVLDVKRRRDHWERARPSGREHPHPKVQKQQKMGEIEKSSEFTSEKRYKIRDHPGGRLGRVV